VGSTNTKYFAQNSYFKDCILGNNDTVLDVIISHVGSFCFRLTSELYWYSSFLGVYITLPRMVVVVSRIVYLFPFHYYTHSQTRPQKPISNLSIYTANLVAKLQSTSSLPNNRAAKETIGQQRTLWLINRLDLRLLSVLTGDIAEWPSRLYIITF